MPGAMQWLWVCVALLWGLGETAAAPVPVGHDPTVLQEYLLYLQQWNKVVWAANGCCRLDMQCLTDLYAIVVCLVFLSGRSS